MIKKYTIVCLVIAQALIAEEEPPFDCCVVVGEPLDPCCVNPMYPYPATYSPSCGWDVYAKGDFLYLSSVIPDALQNPAGNFTLDGSEIEWLFPKTPYRPGFRVSVGMDLGSVILDVTYLRYHPHTTTHFSAKNNQPLAFVVFSPTYAAPLLGQPRAFFQSAKASFNLSLDLGIISLQRPVYMGKKIIMNLNYGILGLWSGEKWHVTATALNPPPPPQFGLTSNGVQKVNHKSWAVGPNLGFTATALFPWNFQVFGGIDLSAQYAVAYKTDNRASYPNYPFPLGNSILRQRHDAAHVQAWHQGELGIGWGDYLFCDRYHLNLSISYNWMYQHIYAYSPAFSPFGTDFLSLTSFSIHGLAVGGRLDF